MTDEDFSRRSLLKAMGAGAAASGLGSVASAADGEAPVDLGAARRNWYRPRQLVAGEQCAYPTGGQVVGAAADFELYGPTDINAQSANGSTAVAVNDEGTVTVFRWPRPSFYDQIKYKTSDRSAERFGAHENVGAFLGLVVDGETTWLREDAWTTDQEYVSERSDAVRTTYRHDAHGLTVEVTDVVPKDADAFVRDVTVERDGNSPVESARLLAFENANLVVSKKPKIPTRDWCEEQLNRDRARYDADLDALVHENEGVDASTGEQRSAALAMGFAGDSTGHQVGGDAFEPAATLAGDAGPTLDAYLDADDGQLTGNDRFVGQTTGALATDLEFEGNRATEAVVFAADEDAAGAGATLDRVRDREMAALRTEKREWIADLLADAPMPDLAGAESTDAIRKLCWRALVTLVTTYDRESGAIVASIATQAPYGEDWIRDGAYFNYALELIGRGDWVEKRNHWYADVQQSATDPEPTYPDTPPGNWPMNHYADGVAGGPITYEIDETGYGAWTLYDHYAVSGDEDYLEAVYPAIKRAADYMVECEDPRNDLQCYASEDDHPEPSQTIVGAATVWLGLEAATEAADVLGRTADRKRYALRQNRLENAIDDLLWDDQRGYYGARKNYPMAPLVWPVCYRDLDDERIQRHLASVWEAISSSFEAPAPDDPDVPRSGLYECKGLIPLAQAAHGDGPVSMEKVRRGLRWVAERHATPDTHIMGEIWMEVDGEVITTVSQPHVWEQILFYLAALEAYPPVEDPPAECGGVIEQLRGDDSPHGRGHGRPDWL